MIQIDIIFVEVSEAQHDNERNLIAIQWKEFIDSIVWKAAEILPLMIE